MSILEESLTIKKKVDCRLFGYNVDLKRELLGLPSNIRRRGVLFCSP